MGRIPGQRPQGWYVGYAQGTGLKNALKRATLKAANDPKVKGFKGKKG